MTLSEPFGPERPFRAEGGRRINAMEGMIPKSPKKGIMRYAERDIRKVDDT